jgi:1-acyl-sn-glycerol-3-phosphate acyltransferase
MDAALACPAGPAGPLTVARSALFLAWFWVWTVVMALLIAPFLVLPWRWMWRLVRFWMAGLGFGLRVFAGIDYRVRGLERVPARPVILAVKHQSAWETFTLPLIRPDVAIVLKRELSALPFFGWYTRKTGMIAVERTAGAKALRGLIEAARHALAERRSILLFPEGTRTTPGEHRPYHPGVAALYGQLDVPVYPVAHDAGRFWPRRGLLKRPGTITVEFLEPIPPGLSRREFMRRLHEAIEGASDRLLAASAPAART